MAVNKTILCEKAHAPLQEGDFSGKQGLALVFLSTPWNKTVL